MTTIYWITHVEHNASKSIFADSCASWQKEAVGNINKLVRQYIPKDADIGTLTDKYIERIRKKINSRPRKKLNFNTPKHEFFKHFDLLCK